MSVPLALKPARKQLSAAEDTKPHFCGKQKREEWAPGATLKLRVQRSESSLKAAVKCHPEAPFHAEHLGTAPMGDKGANRPNSSSGQIRYNIKTCNLDVDLERGGKT